MGVPAYVFFIIVFLADGRVSPYSAPASSPADCTALATKASDDLREAGVEVKGIATSCTEVRKPRGA